MRGCGNYIPINNFIQNEPYPLPTMKSIIRRTAGSRYYSKIDVDQGHLRHPLKEDDWKYTAIILDEVIPGIGDHIHRCHGV
jgi:hypothetical protein